MPTFRITVAYDGTEYCGWQRQADGVSIQGLLEDALREFDERDVTVHGAGRTDAGVHALGQAASFTIERDIDPATIVRALNAKLPEAVRVRAAVRAPDGFHARIAAQQKTYRYRIRNGEVSDPFERRYTWHVTGALDLGAMQTAAAMLVGQHDFAAFQSIGSDVATTVRTIAVSRIADCGLRTIEDFGSGPGALVVYEVTGNGFLRHMVRAIAGTLVEIGLGRRAPDSMADILASRDRASAGRTAPPQGLFLVHVDYGKTLAANP
jgi:tRNA pseudouridine38-40 synthase